MDQRRRDNRRRYDAKRRVEQPWRAWYKSPAWRVRRLHQLAEQPTCALCAEQGIIRLARVVDHHPAHNGDWYAFFHGPVRSLCKACHDGQVQADEQRGFEQRVSEEGWPEDPAHPFNRPSNGVKQPWSSNAAKQRPRGQATGSSNGTPRPAAILQAFHPVRRRGARDHEGERHRHRAPVGSPRLPSRDTRAGIHSLNPKGPRQLYAAQRAPEAPVMA